ncbi:MAG: hypothetical protein DRH57_04140 [Candidatus Cloacimonadota bacterium]|nr:MAG: hypothetical protein DRH57_04140 [Candidatus Cloacimonadota bacterium]
MISVVYSPDLEKYSEQIKYTLSFIFDALGFSYEIGDSLSKDNDFPIIIYYTNQKLELEDIEYFSKGRVFITVPFDEFLYKTDLIITKQITQYLHRINIKQEIPILSEQEFSNPISIIALQKNYYAKLNFDIIGNIFFHVSKNEESYSINRKFDEHKRFLPDESILADFYEVPVVNWLVWLIEQLLLESSDTIELCIPQIKKWPDDKKFAVLISHDVDRTHKWTFHRFLQFIWFSIGAFFTLHWKYIFNNLASLFSYIFTGTEPFGNFDELLSIEADYDIKATYNFGTEHKHKLDPDYHIKDEYIQEIITRLKNAGHEIALHALYESFNNKRELQLEKTTLGLATKSNITGLRHHFFRFHLNSSPLIHSQIGFTYDSSYALQDRMGFRNGVALPFFPYNSHIDKRIDIVELPLAFSDSCLVKSIYENVPFEEAQDKLANLFYNVKNVNGLLTVLFHQSKFSEELPYDRDLFRNLLDLIDKERADIFVDTADKIANWWLKRAGLSLKDFGSDFIVYHSNEEIDGSTGNIVINFHKKMLNIDEVIGADFEVNGNKLYLCNIKNNSDVIIRFGE